MGLICGGCVDCCGVVPVSESEMKTIQKELKKKSRTNLNRLAKQVREPLQCMFVDVDKKNCSIHRARPNICRNYGNAKQLPCPYQPEKATKDYKGKKEKPIGVLGLSITWGNIHEYK